MPTPLDNLGLAGGAIAMALIDKLLANGVIERGDVLAVLTVAQRHLTGFHTAEGAAAAKVVGDLYAKFLKDH